jgi:spore germination cell wall hydrolase CwlJ-like protein
MRAVTAIFFAVFLAFFPSYVGSSTYSKQMSDNKSVECLAKAMYHESRGESLNGMKAVGYVILNRTENPDKFAKTPCGVLYQPGQFSNIRQMKIRDWKTYNSVYKVAETVYSYPNADNTKNATYFHSVHVNPNWSRKMKKTVRYGDHIFMRPNQNV